MKVRSFFAFSAGILFLSGCGRDEPAELTLWGGKQSNELLQGQAEAFMAENKDINVTVGIEDEDTLKDTVLGNPAGAADVFCFPNDQLADLARAGMLSEITEGKEAVTEANGGEESAAVQSAMYEGKLYAYPMTASNGYFMFYDSSYFTEEDVKSLDKMLEIAAANDKYVMMDMTSGWYMYSFFAGAGMSVQMNEEGINECDFNRTDGEVTGVQVAEAVLAIASHPGFKCGSDEAFQRGVEDGSVIAGINGTWNVPVVEAAFGDGYAAAKLPEYTAAGKSLQMGSFAGYKLVGVSSGSKNKNASHKLAAYITGGDRQLERFAATGEGPSDTYAAASEEVQGAPAIKALSEQAPYAKLQNINNSYWEPMVSFGSVICTGNPDGLDLQTLLDDTVSAITADPSK